MIERQKILIVDDDENIAELISLYLVKEKSRAAWAYSQKNHVLLQILPKVVP